ncbi:phosphate/phosphite/phosphonate ABC transporter substrate-binding protein [Streptomyces sp. SID13031]|uniref:phosphate/phosphite/phosphonate ABC transporter substrate-binding protein n=1 Tax=Streptomyces sp. SID13031 TaxID=2706046 RepID=UPI0013C76D4F|nr:phosphate/phosphite/phosphonate ABC transporter substrate-binding protein [Streptomyces sp. SID13031]NEA30616.1 phosphate/phosphite/phosphonate ABC transporter substrate-binding protein [Streptomyces sp. SID13031]
MVFGRARACWALLVAAALVAVAGCGGGTGSGDPDKLVLGVIPYENSSSVADDWKPFAAMLERESGRPVELTVLTDYAALIEGQRAGTIQLAIYGPLSYVLAHDSGAGIEPLGVEIVSKGAKPEYRSYLVTKADSPLRTLADLRGKRICFVDPNSTSGYLYPAAALLASGIGADGYIARYAGGHDATVLGVRDGDCDAGAVQDRLFDHALPAEGRIEPGGFKKIWTSGPIANGPLAVSTRLDPELRKTLARAVTENGNADALGIPELAGVWGFAPVSDAFYDSVRAVCKATKVKLCGG